VIALPASCLACRRSAWTRRRSWGRRGPPWPRIWGTRAATSSGRFSAWADLFAPPPEAIFDGVTDLPARDRAIQGRGNQIREGPVGQIPNLPRRCVNFANQFRRTPLPGELLRAPEMLDRLLRKLGRFSRMPGLIQHLSHIPRSRKRPLLSLDLRYGAFVGSPCPLGQFGEQIRNDAFAFPTLAARRGLKPPARHFGFFGSGQRRS
jgi:hypothetical protein